MQTLPTTNNSPGYIPDWGHSETLSCQVETLNSRCNAGGQREISPHFKSNRHFSFEIFEGKTLETRLSAPCENVLRKRRVKLVADFLLSRDQKYTKAHSRVRSV